MNQLRGKLVNLVLAVDNGRGMEFVKHPIHVAGNYNGRILGWLFRPTFRPFPTATKLL